MNILSVPLGNSFQVALVGICHKVAAFLLSQLWLPWQADRALEQVLVWVFKLQCSGPEVSPRNLCLVTTFLYYYYFLSNTETHVLCVLVVYHLFLLHIYISSVAHPCPTLCDPMDCSTPGFPVHHQLPELAQSHVH